MSSSFWSGRRVLITGATGLLGGWLLERLLEERAKVVALVRGYPPRGRAAQEGLLDRTTTVRGCLEDFECLRRTIAEHPVDTVFHLAAQPLAGVAQRDPLNTLNVNVRGTWNLLEAARRGGVEQIIVASSGKAYGPSDRLPTVETCPLQGRSPYDVSKSCMDLISAMYASTYSLPVAIVRCANLFGGGDLNISRTIPGVIQATLKGERFVIWSDGKAVRDFLYVKDAVQAYLTVAEKMGKDRSLSGEAFNFGLDVRLTILEVVEKVLHMFNRPDLRPVIQNRASSEIKEQYVSCDKARATLGWTPHFSLEEGLRETIHWYLERQPVPATGSPRGAEGGASTFGRLDPHTGAADYL